VRQRYFTDGLPSSARKRNVYKRPISLQMNTARLVNTAAAAAVGVLCFERSQFPVTFETI
jgi:hypothetical protein